MAFQQWGSYMTEIYTGRKGPDPLGTVAFEEIEQKAREARKDYPGSFLFAYGGAGTDLTGHDNLRAFDRYKIVPRMLVDATVRSLETTIFGVKYPSPLFIAPVGVQGICHADAELATARAAGKLNVPFIMSTVSTRCIEEVAQANGDGPRWFQLYWPRTDEVTLSLLSRAKKNGFSVLVVTLDAMTLGWRSNDLQTAYTPAFHGFGIQVGSSDPVFMARYGRQPIYNEHPEFPYDPQKLDDLFSRGDEKVKENVFLSREWIREVSSVPFRSWEELKFIRDNWEGPLVLKGIMSVHNAIKAMEHGANGIVVSNHGGRQIDGALASLYALDMIMQSPRIQEAQRSGKLTVLFDSGIRTGSDIMKACALGAQGVLIGRPWLYGLMIAGQGGVEQVIKHTLADLDVTLGLSGWKNLSDIIGKREEVIVKM